MKVTYTVERDMSAADYADGNTRYEAMVSMTERLSAELAEQGLEQVPGVAWQLWAQMPTPHGRQWMPYAWLGEADAPQTVRLTATATCTRPRVDANRALATV